VTGAYAAGMASPNYLLKNLRVAFGLTQQDLVDRLREHLDAEGVNAALGFRPRTAGPPPRVITQVLDPDSEDPVKRQTFMTGLAVVALGGAAGQPLQPWLAMDRSRSVRPTLIGVRDVEAIQHTAEHFAALDKARGGVLSTDAVLGQLNWASTLLDQGRFASDQVRAQMCTTVGYLAQVAGMSAYDAGLHPQARRALALAVHAAAEAGDWPLRAFALASMARQAITLGQPRQALDLTTLASYGLSTNRHTQIPSALRALLHGATARAQGRTGDAPATLAEIGAAEDSYVPPGPGDPTWLQFYKSAHVAGDCGNAMFDAAQHQTELRGQALQRLTIAAADYGPAHPRSAAFAHARVAALHLDAGDIEPAVEHGRVFTELATGIGSTRISQDRTMLTQHAGPHLDVPAVAALAHTLKET
jgi:hypothetical protein